MRQIMLRSIYAIAALTLASDWAASSELGESLRAADMQCFTRTDWPNTVSKVSCFTSVEEPVIRQKAPAVLAAFQIFSQKRLSLAQQADVMNAKRIEQEAKYRSFYLQSLAVLQAHEPKLLDGNSTLSKEINAMKGQIAAACQQTSMVERVRCRDSIERPIWQRNVATTLKYYDEFQKRHLEFGRRFDASGTIEATRRAAEYFAAGLKQASAEWQENAQRDIQAAYAQDAAAKQQALQTFSEIIRSIADIALAVAEAKTGHPVH
jgi:hypothetical protein